MARIFHRLFLWKLIPSQAVTSVLGLLLCTKTVHCRTKNAYTSEIIFLALVPWKRLARLGKGYPQRTRLQSLKDDCKKFVLSNFRIHGSWFNDIAHNCLFSVFNHLVNHQNTQLNAETKNQASNHHIFVRFGSSL